MLTLEARETVARETYLGLRDSILALLRLWLEGRVRGRRAPAERPPGPRARAGRDGLRRRAVPRRPARGRVDVDSYADLTVAAVAAALGEG